MKPYTSLKNLSSTAAALVALLLIAPAYSQEQPQPDPEEAENQTEQNQDAQAGAQETGEADPASADETAEAGEAETADTQAAEEQSGDEQSAEEQGAEEQSAEDQNYQDLLRGLTWEQPFPKVDANNNSVAEWDELSETYEDELAEADWDQEKAIEPFDRDENGRLDQTEYLFFLSSLQYELSDNESEQEAQS